MFTHLLETARTRRVAALDKLPQQPTETDVSEIHTVGRREGNDFLFVSVRSTSQTLHAA